MKINLAMIAATLLAGLLLAGTLAAVGHESRISVLEAEQPDLKKDLDDIKHSLQELMLHHHLKHEGDGE